MQYALLHEPRRVRIADAPTGAGKSYVFQYAMANNAEHGEGQRVLFIVPTRRMAVGYDFLLRGYKIFVGATGRSPLLIDMPTTKLGGCVAT
ncbi:MAG: DEAD/DEAH box helicase family protein [Candidatus Methylumidiphilus sp.]